jgi:DNA-directed RNA polymerase specialized sigma24 family protein
MQSNRAPDHLVRDLQSFFRPSGISPWPTCLSYMTNHSLAANKSQEAAATFHTRFWRCYRLLHLIACRVLCDSERADHAVENCWLRASQNPPQFEYESELRSWLLRVLLDEAFAILRESRKTLKRGIPFRKDLLDRETNCTKTNCAAESSHKRGVLKMSAQLSTKRVTHDRTLVEFLASPDQIGAYRGR